MCDEEGVIIGDEDLLPEIRDCWRCGASVAWIQDICGGENMRSALICQNEDCGAHLNCDNYPSVEEAIAAWNERPLEDDLRGQIAALTAERDAWRNRYRRARYVWRQRHWEQRGTEASLRLTTADAIKAQQERDTLRQQLADEQATTAQLGDRVEMGIDHLQRSCRRLSELAENRRKDNERLRADLAAALAAAQWQPLTDGEIDLASAGDATGVESILLRDGKVWLNVFVGDEDDTVPVLLGLPDDIALSRRNPAAQVWRPVADGALGPGETLKQNGRVVVFDYDDMWGHSSNSWHLPPGKALCELVTADDAAESEGE